MPNHYSVLGLAKDASAEDIKQTYKRLAMKWHPDKQTTDESRQEAERVFPAMVQAYTILKDPVKKKEYDHNLLYGGIEDEDEAFQQRLYEYKAQETMLRLTFPKPYYSKKFRDQHTKATFMEYKERSSPVRSTSFFTLPIPLQDLCTDASMPCGTWTPPEEKGSVAWFHVLQSVLDIQACAQCAWSWLRKQRGAPGEAPMRQHILALLKALQEQHASEATQAATYMINTLQQDLHSKQDHADTHLDQMLRLYPTLRDKIFEPAFQQQVTETIRDPLALLLEKGWTSTLDQRKATCTPPMQALIQAHLKLKKRLLEQPEEKQTAEFLRELAWECLDQVPFIQDHFSQLYILIGNQHLLACLLLLAAKQREDIPALRYADEVVMTHMQTQLVLALTKFQPLMNVYLCTLLENMWQYMEFQHAGERANLPVFLCRQRQKVIQRIPVAPVGWCSNVDLVLRCSLSSRMFTAQWMHRLVTWVRENAVSREILAQYGETRGLLRLAYMLSVRCPAPETQSRPRTEEAHEDAAQPKEEEDDEENENTYSFHSDTSLDLIEKYLLDQKASFFHVTRNTSSQWNIIHQTSDGWWKLFPETPFNFESHERFESKTPCKTYCSIDGFSIQKDGQVRFMMQEWKPECHSFWQRAFSDVDWAQMMQMCIREAVFSLDPLDTKDLYVPLQKQVCQPVWTKNTELLFAMYAADHLLKMLGSGAEVQMVPPYASRPLDLSPLPEALQQIFHRFYNAKIQNSGHSTLNRIWFKPGELKTEKYMDPQTGAEVFRLAPFRMRILTHAMEIKEGELQDTEDNDDSEGWHLFVVNSIEDFMKRHVPWMQSFPASRVQEYKAIVMVPVEKHVYFLENGLLSYPPRRLTLTQRLQRQLDEHKLDANGRVFRLDATFIFELTTYLCQHGGRDPNFSPHRVYVESLTKYYDVLAQYFPIFERVKQLSKWVAIVRFLDDLRMQDKQVVNQQNVKTSLHSFKSDMVKAYVEESKNVYTKKLETNTVSL